MQHKPIQRSVLRTCPPIFEETRMVRLHDLSVFYVQVAHTGQAVRTTENLLVVFCLNQQRQHLNLD